MEGQNRRNMRLDGCNLKSLVTVGKSMESLVSLKIKVLES